MDHTDLKDYSTEDQIHYKTDSGFILLINQNTEIS